MAETRGSITLEIHLVDHKDAVYVDCDRYEYSTESGWLVLYKGDRETGRYRSKDVIGYHER